MTIHCAVIGIVVMVTMYCIVIRGMGMLVPCKMMTMLVILLNQSTLFNADN